MLNSADKKGFEDFLKEWKDVPKYELLRRYYNELGKSFWLEENIREYNLFVETNKKLNDDTEVPLVDVNQIMIDSSEIDAENEYEMNEIAKDILSESDSKL